MIATTKKRGGFIDQKTLKTDGKYLFESLVLNDANTQVLNGYISYVRPLLKPNCDFVLVNRIKGPHGKLGQIMSKLVFDAIGKYIIPRVIAKFLKCRASISSLTRSRGFCRKTKNTALLLLNFTFKSGNPEKLL